MHYDLLLEKCRQGYRDLVGVSRMVFPNEISRNSHIDEILMILSDDDKFNSCLQEELELKNCRIPSIGDYLCAFRRFLEEGAFFEDIGGEVGDWFSIQLKLADRLKKEFYQRMNPFEKAA